MTNHRLETSDVPPGTTPVSLFDVSFPIREGFTAADLEASRWICQIELSLPAGLTRSQAILKGVAACLSEREVFPMMSGNDLYAGFKVEDNSAESYALAREVGQTLLRVFIGSELTWCDLANRDDLDAILRGDDDPDGGDQSPHLSLVP